MKYSNILKNQIFKNQVFLNKSNILFLCIEKCILSNEKIRHEYIQSRTCKKLRKCKRRANKIYHYVLNRFYRSDCENL